MVGYGTLTLILVSILLKETLAPESRIPLRPATMAANLWLVLHNRRFLSYGTCIFFTMGGLMAFLVSSSSVIIIFFNHTPQAYAYSFGGIMIAYSLFSFISGRIVIKVGIDGLIQAGSIMACISGILKISLALATNKKDWTIN